MEIKRFKNFIKENNTHKGNFKVDSSMIIDGRFKEGIIPEIIDGDFKCSVLNLKSLEGGPKEVGGDFKCDFNKLKNLKGGPNKVGGNFDCSDNDLTSLEGCPVEVSVNFICHHNYLTNLKGALTKVGGIFDCSNNLLTSLKGSPISIKGNFYCVGNQLTSLEGGPKEVEGSLKIVLNINHLNIEADFIKSGFYKNDYWKDLLNYMIKQRIDLDKVEGWPEGFLTNDLISSIKGINKFNL